MVEPHVHYRTHEALEQHASVGPLTDEPEDVAIPSLQHVGEVATVAGHHLAVMLGALPVLVGHCSDLHLQRKPVNLYSARHKISRTICGFNFRIINFRVNRELCSFYHIQKS